MARPFDGTLLGADGKRYADDDTDRPTDPPAHGSSFVTKGALDADARVAAVDRQRAATTRTIDDAVIVEGSDTVDSADANFTDADLGAQFVHPAFPAGTVIDEVTDENTVVLSNEATDGGRTVTDAATTNTDATVTSVAADFTDDDIDATVIASAGFSGEVTIDSINSESSVEMSTTAGSTGTGRTLTILPATFDRSVTIERDLAAVVDAGDADLQAQIDAL